MSNFEYAIYVLKVWVAFVVFKILSWLGDLVAENFNEDKFEGLVNFFHGLNDKVSEYVIDITGLNDTNQNFKCYSLKHGCEGFAVDLIFENLLYYDFTDLLNQLDEVRFELNLEYKASEAFEACEVYNG